MFQNQVFKLNISKANAQQKIRPVADINISNFETSTLSLKSIEKNKEIIDEYSEKGNEYDEKKNISLEDIIGIWEEYANNQENMGRYNIASILRISVPKLEKNNIIYTVPNNTNLLEIEGEKNKLILFISSKLNSKIFLTVKIDKDIEKKVAYTNKDKYELLKEKNPELENFKQALKLSI